MINYKFIFFLLFSFIFGSYYAHSQQKLIITVCDNGNKNINDSVLSSAKILQQELGKSGNFSFQTKLATENNITGAGITFLLIPQAGRIKIKYPPVLNSFNPEGFYIQSSNDRILFIGKTAQALQHAVFTYLDKLGFRYFLPGDEWEIIPAVKTPFIKFDIAVQPDFEYRFLANGHGFNKNETLTNNFSFWLMANRFGGSFPVSIGHSYQVIVANNAETFKKHPEYFAEKVPAGTLPAIFKFNVANKDLVDLVIKDAQNRAAAVKSSGQDVNMISMEPSDGSGWCTTPACLAIGSPSDQAFFLTNKVAASIRKSYPGMWVGSLAYNDHILPPSFKMEPNVFVMVTNGFNRTKFSTTDLLKQWKKKVSKIGVYEYLSVYEWDNDLPGKIPAADLNFVKQSIQSYYESGASVYLAETNIGWINKGPGQYIVSKLLWNHSLNVDSLMEDFYTKAFGTAAPVIKKLYNSWQNYSYNFISDNALAQWLNWVNQAGDIAKDEKVKKRIDEIKIYLHYIALYKQLKDKPSEDNLNKVMNFAYRTFETAAFSTLPVLASLPKYSGYSQFGFYENENQPWKKNNTPVTETELNQLIATDLKSLKTVDGLQTFSLPASFKKLPGWTAPKEMSISSSVPAYVGQTQFIFKIEKQSANNYFEMASGFSAKAEDQKNVEASIYVYTDYLKNKLQAKKVWNGEQSKKDTKEKFSLASLPAGTYFMQVEDWDKMFTLKFSDAMNFSVFDSGDHWLQTSSAAGLNTFYFIVPQNVKRFIVYKSKILKLVSPRGRLINMTDNNESTTVVEVQKGENGLWQVYYQAGLLFLEGIPPYLGLHPDRMLIPAN
ncbi:MAG: DUF4838 domain-containing protein [Bacteroidetes bacterium]|nr:DUF4838 domain-containing protein [Bacteroidota bacterium]MBS1930861.1 DUF4838 domain-containing protein [Bacteroidota bacterium]